MNSEDLLLLESIGGLSIVSLSLEERLQVLTEAVKNTQTFSTCCICLDEVPDQELFELPCGHGGCDGCILTHLSQPLLQGQTVKQCPVCRVSIDSSFLSIGDLTEELQGLTVSTSGRRGRRTCTTNGRPTARATRNRRVIVETIVEESPPAVSTATTAEPAPFISPITRRYRARLQAITDNLQDGNLQDLYETMERDVLPLVKLIQELAPRCLITDDNNSVYEPCCGNGAISNVFKILGFKVIERDLYTRPERHNFLVDDFPEDFDFIVTNPPYNGKKNFLLRCVESKKPFAIFVPIDILFMSNVDTMLQGHRVLVYSPNKTAKFLRNGEYKTVGNVVWLLVDFPNVEVGITIKYYTY